MTKDLSQFFKPAVDSTAKPGLARGQTVIDTTPKVVDQELNDIDFLDSIDFDSVAENNEARTDAGEEIADDGDCDGCKI